MEFLFNQNESLYFCGRVAKWNPRLDSYTPQRANFKRSCIHAGTCVLVGARARGRNNSDHEISSLHMYRVSITLEGSVFRSILQVEATRTAGVKLCSQAFCFCATCPVSPMKNMSSSNSRHFLGPMLCTESPRVFLLFANA